MSLATGLPTRRPLPSALGARAWRIIKVIPELPKLPTLSWAAVFLAGILAPFFTGWGLADPYYADPAQRLLPPVWQEGGTWAHTLGTDQIGRDILARVLHGSQVPLIVGFLTVIIAAIIGTAIALVSGYFGGWVDATLMRLTDAVIAMPFLLVAIVLAGVLGPSLTNVIIILAAFGWSSYARILRSEVLRLKTMDYVSLAKVAGVSTAGILLRHIYPQLVNTLIVVATLQLGGLLIAEAGLAFLGLGVQPPRPSWGVMLSDGRAFLTTAWWMSVFSGVAITITVMGANLMGDWLRLKLDPKYRQLR